MTKIFAKMFEIQLFRIGIDLNKASIFKENILQLLDKSNDNINSFILNFKHLWADNGDAISVYYTGTGTKTSNIAKNG